MTDNEIIATLKPCPFCGCSEIQWVTHYFNKCCADPNVPTVEIISCTNPACGAQIRRIEIEQAVKVWNYRQ
jgi:hypothetical protein